MIMIANQMHAWCNLFLIIALCILIKISVLQLEFEVTVFCSFTLLNCKTLAEDRQMSYKFTQTL